MEKLKKITGQLNDESFAAIESELIKNKSENFLYLLRSYRHSAVKDKQLLAHLKCKENAFYVLKSRLFDKIQNYLLVHDDNELANYSINQQIPLLQYLYEYPRETALAVLHKIEKQNEGNDIPGELIQLYSVLKKAYYHTDKYYHYSQLYNKQVAYAISHEKAEDAMFNFNRSLANYYFSRSLTDKEVMLVLLQEVKNIYSLNQSHRIELIKNFIIIQILLFTDIVLVNEEPIEDLLEKSEKITKQYINDKQIAYFEQPLNYLKYEYCNKINQVKKSLYYFGLVNENHRTWLLQNNTCLAFKFLLSRITVFIKLNREAELEAYVEDVVYDKNDFYTKIGFAFYRSMAKFYNKKLAEAVLILEDIIKESTLVNLLYLEIEIKLTLAFFYFKQEQYQLSRELLKTIYRKTNKRTEYRNAKIFTQWLDLIITDKKKVKAVKAAKLIQQYYKVNSGPNKILKFLKIDFNKVFLPN